MHLKFRPTVWLCLFTLCSQDETYLRFFTVHVQGGKFIVNKLHAHGGQGGLLLKLTDRPLHVLHDHLGITVHMALILHCSDESFCRQLYWHIQKKSSIYRFSPATAITCGFLLVRNFLRFSTSRACRWKRQIQDISAQRNDQRPSAWAGFVPSSLVLPLWRHSSSSWNTADAGSRPPLLPH